jgi:LuxR family transcriptional regulator, glucitol operon activator
VGTRDLLKSLRRDPSYVFRYEDEYVVENTAKLLHNLPSPDFDDTGFVGRVDQLQKLKKAIQGSFPIVTVLGDGGLGKTSIAIKAIYDLLDELSDKFDAIIWTTAKANFLTPNEIVDIEGAIKDSLGIFQSAASVFDSDHKGDPLASLKRWLSEFKVLLVIDNLETILDERIREFAADIPNGSKILFTTRVGLGAYDYPIELRPLAEKEAVDYFRRVCEVYGLDELRRRDSEYIRSACGRLQFNTLAIKWFAQAVRAGGKPAAILADPKLVLKFCFENVITGLSDNARMTLNALVVTARPQTISSLHYIVGLDTVALSASLRELRAANLVTVVPSKALVGDDTYQVTSIANLYIRNYFAPPIEVQSDIRKKQQQLSRARDNAHSINEGLIVYNQSYIFIRGDHTESDTVVAEYLKNALAAIRYDRVHEAEDLIQRAKDMSPNFFEVHRVEAFIAQYQRNTLRAESCYERAISLRPESAPLRRWYGGFLLRINETLRSREELGEAVRLDPDAAILRIELARSCIRLRDFESALQELGKVDVADLNQRETKQTVETWLQLYLGKIETSTSSGELDNAFSAVDGLSDYIDNIPKGLLDNKHLQTIERMDRALARLNTEERGGERGGFAIATGQKLKRLVGVDAAFDALNEQDAADNGGKHSPGPATGVIKTLFIDKKFGFIRDNGGTDWFFHRSEMNQPSQFSTLAQGTAVKFEYGSNDKGPCATAVEIL